MIINNILIPLYINSIIPLLFSTKSILFLMIKGERSGGRDWITESPYSKNVINLTLVRIKSLCFFPLIQFRFSYFLLIFYYHPNNPDNPDNMLILKYVLTLF